MSEELSSVAQLFKECDVHGRGWLILEDLYRVCPHMSDDEIRYIFEQLDKNHDGKIVREEFINGFEAAVFCGEQSGYKGLTKRASIQITTPKFDKPKPEITYNFEPESQVLDQIPCQEDVINLYSQLQGSGVPQILGQFERIIGNFYKELKDQKEQNERLQFVYQKEKEQYTQHLKYVETELDQQVSEAEDRARKTERDKLEKEKEEMRQRLESEISDLEQNIKRLQKMETVLAESSDKAQKINDMKQQIQDMLSENRRLKSNMTDKQTEMAIIKAEFAQLRQNYNEKCEDLDTQKQTLIGYIREQDNLTRQLQLLHDANTKLHDTNDSLRSAVEIRKAFCRKNNLRGSSPISPSSSISQSRQESVSSISSYSHIRNHTQSRPQHLRVIGASWALRDSVETDDDIDSGLARGSDTTGSADDSNLNLDVDFQTPRQGIDLDSELSGLEEDINKEKANSCRNEYTSQTSGYLDPKNRNSSLSSSATRNSDQLSMGHQVHVRKTEKTEFVNLEPTGPPERTFRVVLAGDASVGKSSLIMRLVKDKFIANLTSTLGVDFQVKTFYVDGKNVAIQLWDTAGQERFRSLCKSYFRRADGAILVYDCTSERSFLNVRNWIETIQESIEKKVPILMCSNKVDLRIPATAEGVRCVSREEGEKLAKVFSAIFIETSAKDGTNVKEAALQMARELLAYEDCEVSSSSVVLAHSAKQRTCCK